LNGLQYTPTNVSNENIMFIGEVCRVFQDKLTLWFSFKNMSGSDELENALNQQGCQNLIFEPESMYRLQEAGYKGLEKRVDKIAAVRSAQRQSILKYVRQFGVKFDVLFNIDLDLVQMGTLDSVLASLMRTYKGDGKTIRCANGYQMVGDEPNKHALYYDSFATIFEEGTWLYWKGRRKYIPPKTRKGLRIVPRRDQTELLNYLTGNAVPEELKPWLWGEPQGLIVPVQTCFGGMAFYPFKLWSEPKCDYVQERMNFSVPRIYKRIKNEEGEVCEHVTMQLCLRDEFQQRNQSVALVIDGDNLCERGTEDH